MKCVNLVGLQLLVLMYILWAESKIRLAMWQFSIIPLTRFMVSFWDRILHTYQFVCCFTIKNRFPDLIINLAIYFCLNFMKESVLGLYLPHIYTEKSFRNIIKSSWNQIVSTVFRLVLIQTDFRLDPNQSENDKWNLISVWFDIILERFLCVRVFA